MATGFITNKQIKNLCNCEHVSFAVYGCKRCGRKREETLEVPDSRLVVCGTVSTCKMRLSSGKYFLQFQVCTAEEQRIVILERW